MLQPLLCFNGPWIQYSRELRVWPATVMISSSQGALMKSIWSTSRRYSICLLQHGVHMNQTNYTDFSNPVWPFLDTIDVEINSSYRWQVKGYHASPHSKECAHATFFPQLINYYMYGKFIPNAATILAPLNNLLCRDADWKWSTKCQKSFYLAKKTLVSSEVLVHYNPDLPIHLEGDASAYGVGAVIAHMLSNGSEHLIAFASRMLISSKRNYTQVEKVAFSLILGWNASTPQSTYTHNAFHLCLHILC